jgi:hypothetical protein
MAASTGVSVIGGVVLLAAPPPLVKTLSVAITSQPVPPQRRVGYFYVYAFIGVSPFQCFILKGDAVYAPGIYEDFPANLIDNSYNLRVDIKFEVGNLNCTVVLI